MKAIDVLLLSRSDMVEAMRIEGDCAETAGALHSADMFMGTTSRWMGKTG